MGNNEAVSRPSHRSLEDADAAGVSHYWNGPSLVPQNGLSCLAGG